MKQKVLAYIIREKHGKQELLVHGHRDYPEAGLQVPAGTAEAGEPLEQALFREIQEETGITDVQLLEKLEVYSYFNEYRNEVQERHVFLLRIIEKLPERWDHIVEGDGEDEGLVFICSWLPIEGLQLSGEMGKSLKLIQAARFRG
ncbi:NUDIX hydrolase [Mesobacillus subterraneus]|uniref:NUDIX hydrolase n=1 Tax=Mesobacillus subterraneus TaxID=285983 RepID=UPI0014751D44|nr:NUDIX domain-containing protein [Mesobacillus subterraneus]